ncbi:hypothetical protein KSS87_001459 [Heliosperma pusillum]|nr:hypothetical protein KSS87_001459 [Heliosperma pusillum]
MTDGIGFVQFLNAVVEFARGAQCPSITPVWMRHLISDSIPNPSHYRNHDVCSDSYEYTDTPSPPDDLVNKSFFFGSAQIASLRQSIPRSSTTFELIVAHLWRCHALSLYNDPQKTVILRFAINIRSKYNPSLPTGYYGNAIATPMVEATIAELSENPFQYVVDLVKRTKENVTEEYLKSLADRTENDGRIARKLDGLAVTDHRRLGFKCLDFGWGRPIYGGFLRGSRFVPNVGCITCLAPFKHFREFGVLVPICLPRFATKRQWTILILLAWTVFYVCTAVSANKLKNVTGDPTRKIYIPDQNVS